MRKFLFLIPFLLCAITSCKDDQIRTYKVATDSSAESPALPATEPTSVVPKQEAPHPAEVDSVIWQAPDNWKHEAASQFLTAAYTLPGGGRVTVSKLGGDGGGLAANINRWRSQLGFEPLDEKDVAGQPLKVTDSNAEMLLFNLTKKDSTEDAQGILAGILPLKLETWYFKFSAPVGILRKSEALFLEFLRSVRTPSSQKNAPAPSPSGGKEIHVTAPEGWTSSEGSSMRVASFSIAGPEGISADVSVVPLPGDAGSILDNVNRWRSQLQLSPLASADDPALGKKEQTPIGEIFISHMISIEPVTDGKKAAIGTAILKRAGMTWFFKITGEATLVQANLEKFDSFVRSATFP